MVKAWSPNHLEQIDRRLIKALSHPLRVQLLIILNERVASPNELSKELDENLNQVAYHVKVLRDFGCVELVKTRQRRGATEHFYRAIQRPLLSHPEWDQIPGDLQSGISGAILKMIYKDVAEAVKGGTFDSREDSHLSRTPMVVDERGWRDTASLLTDTLEGLLRIQAESAERLAESGEEGILSKTDIMHFESPDPSLS